jgi:hypothetical protein
VTTLSVENLYDLADDAVVSQVGTAFTTQLELSPSVHSTFFASTNAAWPGPAGTDWTDSVGTALACSAISRSTLYEFSRVVDGNASDAWWKGQLAGAPGLAASRALYDWAFPDFCTDGSGTTFAAYLANNPASWAAKLAAHLTAPQFINNDLDKLIAGQLNWLDKVNLSYYKLHRLDLAQETAVVAAWTAAYPQAIEQWQTNNYLAKLFSPDVWVGAVNAAISVPTTLNVTGSGGPGFGVNQEVTTYGDSVVNFLSGKPSRLGLAIGGDPVNR